MIKGQEHNEVKQERISNWQLSRGTFLKTLVALGVSTQLTGCSGSSEEVLEDNAIRITPIMSNQQANIIKIVQSILFPDDGNGPSVEVINAFPYLLWYLQDELIEKYERDFFVRGADWVNQEALSITNVPFLELTNKTQVKMVGLLAKKKRTKVWLSKLLTSIFEALLSDPIYGGNPDEIGWKWLGHNSGSPRPTDENNYPNILKVVRNEV